MPLSLFEHGQCGSGPRCGSEGLQLQPQDSQWCRGTGNRFRAMSSESVPAGQQQADSSGHNDQQGWQSQWQNEQWRSAWQGTYQWTGDQQSVSWRLICQMFSNTGLFVSMWNWHFCVPRQGQADTAICIPFCGGWRDENRWRLLILLSVL